MTIEAGVLSLRITETGAEQVEAKLRGIDNKAKALGTTTTTLHFAAPSLGKVQTQVADLGRQAALIQQQFANTARFANIGTSSELTRAVQIDNALRRSVAAANDLGESKKKLAGASDTLTASLGRQVLAYVGIHTAVRAYNAVTDAADRQETAQRKLSATARLTGQSLATITALSTGAQQRFALSAFAAADLTQAFVKLAGRSGDVSQAGNLMNAWMDLAAAQGLSLSDVLTGVNTTLVGQDEGLNRLGLLNPSNIWKQWADAAGTTVAKMTEQQKWQSIINAVTQEGAKVQGEYGKQLDTTLGKQQQFTAAFEGAAAIIGRSFAGMREGAYGFGTALANLIVWADKFFSKGDQWARDFDQKWFPGLAFIFGQKIVPPAGKFTPQGPTPEQLRTGRAAPIAIVAPKPLTAAEAAAAREAAEQARAQRAVDRINVGMAGVTDITATDNAGRTAANLARIGLVGVDSSGKMKGVSKAATVIDAEFDALVAKMQERRQQLGELMQGVGSVLGDALASGVTAAFQGGNFFAEMGKALLSGIGGMLVQLGSAMLTYGLLMAVGAPLLMLTPFAAQALSAPAAIAAGTGLIALGAGMGALAGGGKGGGGGGGAGKSGPPVKDEPNEFAVAFDPDRKLRKSGPAVVPSSRSLSSAPLPEGRPPIVFAPTIIGQDDPKAQRQLATMVEIAVNRGVAPGIRGRR